MLATLAVNEALLCPAVTATLAGTVMLALLLDSATVAPEGAVAVKVTVQLDVPGAFTVAGEQLNVLSDTGVGSVMVPEPPPAEIGVPAAVEATTPFRTTPIVVVEGFAAI